MREIPEHRVSNQPLGQTHREINDDTQPYDMGCMAMSKTPDLLRCINVHIYMYMHESSGAIYSSLSVSHLYVLI